MRLTSSDNLLVSPTQSSQCRIHYVPCSSSHVSKIHTEILHDYIPQASNHPNLMSSTEESSHEPQHMFCRDVHSITYASKKYTCRLPPSMFLPSTSRCTQDDTTLLTHTLLIITPDPRPLATTGFSFHHALSNMLVTIPHSPFLLNQQQTQHRSPSVELSNSKIISHFTKRERKNNVSTKISTQYDMRSGLTSLSLSLSDTCKPLTEAFSHPGSVTYT